MPLRMQLWKADRRGRD